jgi:molybdenum cofactor biosynthesis enzyme
MEAITAAVVTLITIYDMVKAVDKTADHGYPAAGEAGRAQRGISGE